MSKSQIQTQVFVYIIAIILFSFVLVYGYNAIRGFKERSEQVAYIKFKTDLTSAIKRISPDFGTLKREEFFIGGEYTKVCFVQNYDPRSDLANYIDGEGQSIIADSVRGGVSKNVFLFTNSLQESLDIGKITVEGDYGCFNVLNGKLKVQFEGMGDHAHISGW